VKFVVSVHVLVDCYDVMKTVTDLTFLLPTCIRLVFKRWECWDG